MRAVRKNMTMSATEWRAPGSDNKSIDKITSVNYISSLLTRRDRMMFHTRFGQPADDWKDPDFSVLDDRRVAVPDVPLELLPEPWRAWIADTERATGAPVDPVLQSVL